MQFDCLGRGALLPVTAQTAVYFAVTLQTERCTVYSVRYTVYSIQCTVYNIQYTVYSIQCTE